MSNQWSVSMRPRKLDELFGCDNIKKFFGKTPVNQWPTSILLQGCFGNSKTSTALILATMLTCTHPKENGDPCLECENCKTIINETFNRGNVLFLDGSVLGKDDVIDSITTFMDGAPFGSPRKVCIIDEAQELSTAASKSLLKILETPRKNVHLILTSMGNSDSAVKSGSGKEVPKSIVSRCQTFIFKKAEITELMFFLKTMLERQDLWNGDKLPKEFKTVCLQMIADNSAGSYRQALQTLEQCITLQAYTPEAITENLGLQDIVSFYEMMLQIMDGKTSEGVFNQMINGDYVTVFNYSYKVVSDAVCYKMFGKIPGEYTSYISQAKAVSSHPKFPILLKHYEDLAQKTNPYLKKADFIIGMCNMIEACKSAAHLTEEELSVIEKTRRVKRG